MEKQYPEYITLQQFLKKEQLAASGGEAKHLVKTLLIFVNGEREDRRGRKLYKGDEVRINGKTYVVE